jgi:hypothetical protein
MRLARLEALFEAILEEARRNKAFGERLETVLSRAAPSPPRGRNRRAKAVLNPFEIFDKGEDHLRTTLSGLTLEQLKDVVAEYGMDRSRLALKWKSPERVGDLVVETVKARMRKGDAFRPAAKESERSVDKSTESAKLSSGDERAGREPGEN